MSIKTVPAAPAWGEGHWVWARDGRKGPREKRCRCRGLASPCSWRATKKKHSKNNSKMSAAECSPRLDAPYLSRLQFLLTPMIIIIPDFQMRDLSPERVRHFPKCHTAGSGRTQTSSPGMPAEPLPRRGGEGNGGTLSATPRPPAGVDQ